jgi:hypothetical protein
MRIGERFAAREAREAGALSIEPTIGQPICDRERSAEAVEAMLRPPSSRGDTRGAARRAQAQPRRGIHQESDATSSPGRSRRVEPSPGTPGPRDM